MFAYLATVLKAIYAGLVGFLTSLATVLVGNVGFGDVTAGQWVAAVLAGMALAGGVWRIPNRKTTAEGATGEPDAHPS